LLLKNLHSTLIFLNFVKLTVTLKIIASAQRSCS